VTVPNLPDGFNRIVVLGPRRAILGGADVEFLAPGGDMMLAMITTVVGLIVGIIAFFAYNTLVSRIGKVIHEMEASAVEFIDILEQPGN
jgi:biopolymer transport protein ExbB